MKDIYYIMSAFNSTVECYECGEQLYFHEFFAKNREAMILKISQDPVVVDLLPYTEQIQLNLKEMLDDLQVTKKCCRNRYLGNPFIHRV